MTKEALGDMIVQDVDRWYRITKTILKEDVDCEDAVSEAIVKGFTKIHTLKQDEYVKTWFTRILINECYNILRRQGREMTYDEQLSEREMRKNDIGEKDYSDLYQNMMTLSDDYRIPLLLYYVEGFKINEIAQLLELKENTVKMRLSRGRIKLRRLFEQEDVI